MRRVSRPERWRPPNETRDDIRSRGRPTLPNIQRIRFPYLRLKARAKYRSRSCRCPGEHPAPVSPTTKAQAMGLLYWAGPLQRPCLPDNRQFGRRIVRGSAVPSERGITPTFDSLCGFQIKLRRIAQVHRRVGLVGGNSQRQAAGTLSLSGTRSMRLLACQAVVRSRLQASEDWRPQAVPRRVGWRTSQGLPRKYG